MNNICQTQLFNPICKPNSFNFQALTWLHITVWLRTLCRFWKSKFIGYSLVKFKNLFYLSKIITRIFEFDGLSMENCSLNYWWAYILFLAFVMCFLFLHVFSDTLSFLTWLFSLFKWLFWVKFVKFPRENVKQNS